MTACPVFAISLTSPSPRTAAELHDRIDTDLTNQIEKAAHAKKAKIIEGDSAAFWKRTALRTAFRHLTRIFDRPLEIIYIDEIITLTTEDYEQKLGVNHRRAIWHLWAQTKMAAYAASYGWTSEAWRRREAWEPIRFALTASKGGSVGCQGIITWAIRNLWWPATFSDAAAEAWILWMVRDQRRSLQTADIEMWNFRRKLRDAGLQALLPEFDLAPKSPPSYCLSRKSMRPELLQEIINIIHWKMHDCDVEFRIRQVTADSLFAVLQALCGYATYVKGICGITSVKQVIVEGIVTDFIPWLHHGRDGGWSASWASIRTTLGYVHALIKHKHPLFAEKQEEYAWFGRALRGIPKDSKQELRKRKLDKAVAYETFAGMARKILAELVNGRDLDPFERAKLFRNWLFCLALSKHPWRQRNWRTCRADDQDTGANICFREIPDDVLADLKIRSGRANSLLDNYDEELMWMCHWVEDGTKGGSEIWEMLDPELIDPLKEYMEIHRKILVDRGPGAVSLFVTNGGRDMHKDYMIDLLAELSLRYSDTGKRLSPHIVRDIVVEHALANGCTFEEVQQMLWHKRAKSTQRYMSGFNASHASVVLEKNLATADLGRI